jgi:hypothetical protein
VSDIIFWQDVDMGEQVISIINDVKKGRYYMTDVRMFYDKIEFWENIIRNEDMLEVVKRNKVSRDRHMYKEVLKNLMRPEYKHFTVRRIAAVGRKSEVIFRK